MKLIVIGDCAVEDEHTYALLLEHLTHEYGQHRVDFKVKSLQIGYTKTKNADMGHGWAGKIS